MHAIFDYQNRIVNRFSKFVVKVVSYNLVLACTVNNSLKNIIMTISLRFWSLVSRCTNIGTITNNKIISSPVQLTELFFLLVLLPSCGNHFVNIQIKNKLINRQRTTNKNIKISEKQAYSWNVDILNVQIEYYDWILGTLFEICFSSTGRCESFLKYSNSFSFVYFVSRRNCVSFFLSSFSWVFYLAVLICGVVIGSVTSKKKLPPNHDITFT